MKAVIEEFYTDDVHKSESFGRIVNARHFAWVSSAGIIWSMKGIWCVNNFL